ncbi:catabolite repression protein CAT5 [Coccidioides immitis RMSCC 3703]|uniref:Catabolite repression protein CAT5 n=1 Tax=Coccidioides immitis RMSCC 3703 TaxID=454286 RepID=A0A0J8TLA0_COCIT|nr:catabolite repression protein CAT5 [Coccidioides immitis RMSCC 3703]
MAAHRRFAGLATFAVVVRPGVRLSRRRFCWGGGRPADSAVAGWFFRTSQSEVSARKRASELPLLVPSNPSRQYGVHTADRLAQHRRWIHARLVRGSVCSQCLRTLQPRVRHSSTTSHRTASPAEKPRMALTKEQRDFLDSALRVNQAGELAATLIYTAQSPPVVRSHPHLRPLMKHMYDQEAGHFDTFNKLIAKHRVRPTVMYPIWEGVSTFLGWSTGIMGREAAMACTEAVETEIGTHYE